MLLTERQKDREYVLLTDSACRSRKFPARKRFLNQGYLVTCGGKYVDEYVGSLCAIMLFFANCEKKTTEKVADQSPLFDSGVRGACETCLRVDVRRKNRSKCAAGRIL